MKFKDNGVTAKGVTERVFDLEAMGRRVPGIIWTPEGAKGPRPLVLLGHGGSQNKRSDHILALGRRLVRHADFAATAIDAIAHGERDSVGTISQEERSKRTSSDAGAQEMIEDWKATLDALQELDEVGTGPVGYYGVSMGARFGVPFIAAEPRIKAVVLGLFFAINEPYVELSSQINIPLLFVQQLEDELMERDKVLELFDAFGTRDKRLHANPGKHTEMPADQFMAIEKFLIERLSKQ